MQSAWSLVPQPARPNARSAACRAAWLLALCLGCEKHYVSSVPLAPHDLPPAVSLACAGVLRPETGRIDEASSDRLARRSGCTDLSGALGPEELSLLLADPAAIALAGDRLDAIQARIGFRFLLLGQTATSPVDETARYSILLPLPIIVPLPFVWLIELPIPYRRRDDVPHASLAMRLVDLESGRVTAEHFAIDPSRPGDPERQPPAIDEALVGMGLRAAANP